MSRISISLVAVLAGLGGLSVPWLESNRTRGQDSPGARSVSQALERPKSARPTPPPSPVQDPAVVAPAAPVKKLLDVRKGVIESPTKALVADHSGRVPSAPPAAADNPKVAPGQVRWHASLADASVAARQSGKPVLLFHLLGNLDDRFC